MSSPDLVGTLIGGKFRVERALGAGGMGSVWVAVQEPLGRRIALKVIHHGNLDVEQRARFEQEARAVAHMKCPHIVTLHDFGDHEGAPYLAMELLEGETLRERMLRGGVLLHEALGWVRDLACALRSAHEEGIVHRDVKPENIILVRDRDRGSIAKLLDFGIAKLRARAGAEGLTQFGMFVGTPGYIAPEVVLDGTADAPTLDVYSAGVVLFELVTGTQPYSASNPLALLMAHAHQPQPEATQRSPMPVEVSALLDRLLSKNPTQRPADGAALVAAIDEVRVRTGATGLTPTSTPFPLGPTLGGPVASTPHASAWGGAPPSQPVGSPPASSPLSSARTETGPLPLPARPSLAVQPFQALGGDDEELFAEGISEDILTALSCFKQLFVVSVNSMVLSDGRDTDPLRVSRSLGVRYVVQGSVRRTGDRVRVNAKLVDASTGVQVWAQRYDRDVSHLFEVQDDVTRAIVAAVVGRLEEAEAEAARRKAPHALAAWDWLARGRALHHRRTPEDNRAAREALDRAVEIDPDYAQAHAWRACAYGQAVVMGAPAPGEMMGEVARSVERALALDDNDAECHRLAAEMSASDDLDRAWYHHERALALNPNDARIVGQRGELSIYRGDLDLAAASLEAALRLDPLSPKPYLRHLSVVRYLQRDLDTAATLLRQIPEPRPDIQCLAVAVAALRGDTEDVRRRLARLAEAGIAFTTPHKPFAEGSLRLLWEEGFERATAIAG